MVSAAQLTPAQFWETITRGRVLSSFEVSLVCALTAALINLAMGVLLAWVLVRYDFPASAFWTGSSSCPSPCPPPRGYHPYLPHRGGGLDWPIFSPLGHRIAYTRLG